MTSPTNQELSALVARKVYGWHPLKLDPQYMARVLNKRGTAAGMFTERTPLFATDPGLALEAALKARGGLDLWIIPQSNGTTLVAISLRDDGYTRDVDLVGSTVARALCFAALRAVGVDAQDDGGER